MKFSHLSSVLLGAAVSASERQIAFGRSVAESSREEGNVGGNVASKLRRKMIETGSMPSSLNDGESMSFDFLIDDVKPKRSKSRKSTTSIAQVGINVMMEGIGELGNQRNPSPPEYVWSIGPVNVTAYCEAPKDATDKLETDVHTDAPVDPESNHDGVAGRRRLNHGPRGTYLKLEMTVTAPADEDLYIIGASCPGQFNCFITTNDRNNRHRLKASQKKSFWLLYDFHQAYETQDGGALYIMYRNGDYYYVGWNQQQFVGLHEDDLEIRDFLDDGDEMKPDCLIMGAFDYYMSPSLKGGDSKSSSSGDSDNIIGH